MKAKEIFFEFLDTVLVSFIIVFIIFYFIVGNNLKTAVFFVKLVVPFSFFGLIFIAKFELNKRKLKKMDVEINWDEPLVYLTNRDKLKDWFVVGGLFLVILAIPLFFGNLVAVDFFQSLAMLIISTLRHIFLFKGKEKGNLISITQFDRLKDEIIIFFIPVAMTAISLLAQNIGLLDTIQAVVAVGGMYFWHCRLFKQS